MSDDFDVSKVKKASSIKTFAEWEEDFKDRHPVYWWIDNVLFPSGGLFGYAPHYSITHPHVLLSDLADQIKWAYQRVVRGWDDRASWSVDYWLDNIMPDVLTKLKADKHGVPTVCYEGLEHDENYSFSDEQDTIAKEIWDYELDKMIAGFKASKDKENFESIEDYDALEEVRVSGMTSFVKYYNNLWD